MTRILHRLSAVGVDATKAPGYYADGGGLYLRVAPGRTRAWIFRFTLGGKKRDGGLGPYPTVSLAKARAAAERCRQLIAAGVDSKLASWNVKQWRLLLADGREHDI